MRSIPFELPIKAAEAASLADVIFDQLDGRALTSDSRSRVAGRFGTYASFDVLAGSLQRDPIHPSVYYIAVTQPGKLEQAMLLRVALASSPASGLFPKALLIGRMRTSSGREMVINAIPFTPEDGENIRTFVEKVDPAFAPRPRGACAGMETASFEAQRAILDSTGFNFACIHTARL